MKRTVNRGLIDAWIVERKASELCPYPDPLTELAVETNIPASSLQKIRTGRAPTDRTRRQILAEKIGVTEAELFPVTPDPKKQAS